jgi:hypothetical protein
MDHREIGLGGCGLDSTGSGQGPVAGCCEFGDEPSGSCATEFVSYKYKGKFDEVSIVSKRASHGISFLIALQLKSLVRLVVNSIAVLFSGTNSPPVIAVGLL